MNDQEILLMKVFLVLIGLTLLFAVLVLILALRGVCV